MAFQTSKLENWMVSWRNKIETFSVRSRIIEIQSSYVNTASEWQILQFFSPCTSGILEKESHPVNPSETLSPNFHVRHGSRVILLLSCAWEALRRYEAINQFFHSRRRMPWRWRFLLRYVINQVLKGGTKKKCLGNSQWRKSCYIIRATVFKHFSCHHCFSRRTSHSIDQLLVFRVTLSS